MHLQKPPISLEVIYNGFTTLPFLVLYEKKDMLFGNTNYDISKIIFIMIHEPKQVSLTFPRILFETFSV